MNTDRILKSIVLKAPRSRVWRALTESKEFGSWFGVRFSGPFEAGATMVGRATPTTVDAEVAKLQEPYAGAAFEIVIDRIEPETLFSFKWHPFAIDPEVDYSHEPRTTVTFTLEVVESDAGGTKLTVTEEGFDKIPLARRAEALKANDGGWAHQMQLITKYLALHAK